MQRRVFLSEVSSRSSSFSAIGLTILSLSLSLLLLLLLLLLELLPFRSDTPGCKAEGDTFNSLASEFSAKGCQLIGISMEDVESLKNSNAGRDIQLLSDADGAISAAFDAELNLVLAKFSARKTFLLSPSGEIKAKWSEVSLFIHNMLNDFFLFFFLPLTLHFFRERTWAELRTAPMPGKCLLLLVGFHRTIIVV